jgi:hypothetical protein
VPHDQLYQAAMDAVDHIFMSAAGELNDGIQLGLPVCMIGHVNVAGSIASTGQPQIGREIEITQAHLARLPKCYKGLNHIHKSQWIGGAFYTGSLCRLNWGEIEPKGYSVITWTRSDQYNAWDWEHYFETIPVPPMYHVEAIWATDRWGWSCTDGPDGKRQSPPDSWKDKDVRVRARFPQAERNIVDWEQLRQIFADARRYSDEPIAVTDRVLRSAEVMQAQTLDQKLHAWAKMSKVSWSSTITACASRLQATTGADAIVRDVEDRLAVIGNIEAMNDEVRARKGERKAEETERLVTSSTQAAD